MNQENVGLDSQTLIIEQDNKIIEEAYRMIKDASQKVGKASNKVYSAIEFCTEEDFSVRGVTYEEAVENCSNCFQFSSKNIREYAELLMEALRTDFDYEMEQSSTARRVQEEPSREEPEKKELKILYRTTSEDININIPKGGV